MHQSESFEEALRRELQEELRLRVTESASPLASIADSPAGLTIHFIPTKADGEPEPLEHSSVGWIRPSRVAEYSLAPADQAFVENYFDRRT